MCEQHGIELQEEEMNIILGRAILLHPSMCKAEGWVLPRELRSKRTEITSKKRKEVAEGSQAMKCQKTDKEISTQRFLRMEDRMEIMGVMMKTIIKNLGNLSNNIRKEWEAQLEMLRLQEEDEDREQTDVE